MEQKYTLIEITKNEITAEELERQLSFVLPSLFQTINVLNRRVYRLENRVKKIIRDKQRQERLFS